MYYYIKGYCIETQSNFILEEIFENILDAEDFLEYNVSQDAKDYFDYHIITSQEMD